MNGKRPIKSIMSTRVLLCLILLWVIENAQAQHRPTKYDKTIKIVAEKYRLEPALIHSIILTESNYDPLAISSKGAIGLMQLMPETAKAYGVVNPFDPAENIEGGAKYLKDLIHLFNGRTRLVLAAYNAGQEAIKKNGGIPRYPETINYVRKVMALYPESYIRRKTLIYRLFDSSGKMILTNNPYLCSSNGGKEENN
jgi:soluble lytic murein transglycosylase-like protein